MFEPSASWTALCSLVFLLGVRHGFDADHLAAIDGLTRLGLSRKSSLARFSGAFFSAGHGAVVVLIALAVGTLSEQWQVPAWLDGLGASISIMFLLTLGLANLRAVVSTPAHRHVPLVGLKGNLLSNVQQTRGPWGTAAVGALFAVSFDTISQSALFAMTAAQFGGAWHALVLGLIFMLGMVLTDGVNGWWISRLIDRADRTAVIASRVMGLAVAGVSLLVAGLGIAKLSSAAADRWGEGKELLFGVAVVAVIALSYAFARALGRRQNPIPDATDTAQGCR